LDQIAEALDGSLGASARKRGSRAERGPQDEANKSNDSRKRDGT
jgi:hypothetical protein